MIRWLVGLLALAAVMPLQAETIYRWVDADGGVHFSATPPPGMDAETQDLHYNRGDPAAAAAAMQRYQQDIDNRREEIRKASRTAAAAGAMASERQQRCAQARGVLSRMQGVPGVRYQQDDGSYRRYTDAERNDKLSAAQASVRENCD